jgi:hypothetical protein
MILDVGALATRGIWDRLRGLYGMIDLALDMFLPCPDDSKFLGTRAHVGNLGNIEIDA